MTTEPPEPRDSEEPREQTVAGNPRWLTVAVPTLGWIIAGSILQQLQTSWGWAAILLAGAVFLPLALAWGHRDVRARPLVVRIGYPVLGVLYIALTATFAIFSGIPTLWKVSLTAPVATAALALPILRRGDEELSHSLWCVAAVGVGVATLGPSAAYLAGGGLAVGAAGIVAGLAAIGVGVGGLVRSDGSLGLAVAGVGVGLVAMGGALLSTGVSIAPLPITTGLLVIAMGIAMATGRQVARRFAAVAAAVLGVLSIGWTAFGAIPSDAVDVGIAGIVAGVAVVFSSIGMLLNNDRMVGAALCLSGLAYAAIGVFVIAKGEFTLGVACMAMGGGVIAWGAAVRSPLETSSSSAP